MFTTLASYGVEVVDIEQIVVRGRLVLAVLVSAPREWKALRDRLTALGADLGMRIDVDRGTGDNDRRAEGRSHVTVLGSPLRAAAVSAVSGRIADLGRPILVGASRKAFLGALLADAEGRPRPVGERESAHTAIVTHLAQAGVWCTRVHDVRATRDAFAVTQKMTQKMTERVQG